MSFHLAEQRPDRKDMMCRAGAAQSTYIPPTKAAQLEPKILPATLLRQPRSLQQPCIKLALCSASAPSFCLGESRVRLGRSAVCGPALRPAHVTGGGAPGRRPLSRAACPATDITCGRIPTDLRGGSQLIGDTFRRPRPRPRLRPRPGSVTDGGRPRFDGGIFDLIRGGPLHDRYLHIQCCISVFSFFEVTCILRK